MKSFTALLENIFSNIPGADYFMSEKTMPGPLGGVFGKQRMRRGYSENSTVHSFLHGTVSLRTQRSIALAPKRGNCKRQRELPIALDPTPLPKRTRTKKKEVLNNSHFNKPNCNTHLYIISLLLINIIIFFQFHIPKFLS